MNNHFTKIFTFSNVVKYCFMSNSYKKKIFGNTDDEQRDVFETFAAVVDKFFINFSTFD